MSGLIEGLARQSDRRIVYLIVDGLGGLTGEDGRTELDAAAIPNLDRLARESACGLLDPVAHGVTPGSGPGHFALFGYDPVGLSIGRGVLSALGVGFPLRPADVAARVNLATADAAGRIVDRRAGRIADEAARQVCRRVRSELRPPGGVEAFLEHEKEHRAVLVLRGEGLDPRVADTDPGRTGQAPEEVRALAPSAEPTAGIVRDVLSQAHAVLAAEGVANRLLLRGFDSYRPIPGLGDRFALRPIAFADYPFYRGVARLVGMSVETLPGRWRDQWDAVRSRAGGFDFVFLHIKDPDARGEDGDFAGKVRALEEVDRLVPEVLTLEPEVLVVTGDHSTPARLRAHSWHPVPVLLRAASARRGGTAAFTEMECVRGTLGRLPMQAILPLALAHAGRLKKYGA